MSAGKKFYILGDLLLNISKSHIIKKIRLVQLVDPPIRVTTTSATLLDFIITNNPDLVLAKVVPNLISEHDLISIKINITKPRRQLQIKTFSQLRNYKKKIFLVI